jgi:hypothetical protein
MTRPKAAGKKKASGKKKSATAGREAGRAGRETGRAGRTTSRVAVGTARRAVSKRPAARQATRRSRVLRARDLMTRTPIMVREEMPIGELCDLLQANNVNGAPVVDEQGYLLGVVTQEDIIYGAMGSPAGKQEPGDLPERGSQARGKRVMEMLRGRSLASVPSPEPTPGDVPFWADARRPQDALEVNVSAIMTSPAISADESTPIAHRTGLIHGSLPCHPDGEDHRLRSLTEGIGMRTSIDPALCSAPLLVILSILLASCGEPAVNDPLGGVIRSLPAGESVLYARTLAAEDEEGPPEGVVAVVSEAAGRLQLRVYDWDGRSASLAHTVPGGETFQNLDLFDADGDGRREIVVIWGGGRLSVVEVIGRQGNDRYRSLFQNAGSEIEIHQTPGGRLELLITGRTYEEEAGQPPVYETIPYRWDGERFSPATAVPSR